MIFTIVKQNIVGVVDRNVEDQSRGIITIVIQIFMRPRRNCIIRTGAGHGFNPEGVK